MSQLAYVQQDTSNNLRFDLMTSRTGDSYLDVLAVEPLDDFDLLDAI